MNQVSKAGSNPFILATKNAKISKKNRSKSLRNLKYLTAESASVSMEVVKELKKENAELRLQLEREQKIFDEKIAQLEEINTGTKRTVDDLIVRISKLEEASEKTQKDVEGLPSWKTSIGESIKGIHSDILRLDHKQFRYQ